MISHVRWSIWETNSSSVHKVVITDEGPRINEIPQTITITTNSYEWENRTYRSLEDKLSYLVSCINSTFSSHSEELKILETMLHEIGIEEITYEIGDDWYPGGDVDHAYTWYNKFFADMISNRDVDKLKQYLFNHWSYVETGNDNGY